jgi:hypothetical protein
MTTVNSVERRAQATALRREGKTYARIGQIMRISEQAAHRLVKSALQARRLELDESVDEVRTMELERLDKLTRVMFLRLDDHKNADPERTVTAILRISERRANLLGLDAPKDFRIAPGGSNVVPVTGDLDVGKLSTDELRELERIQVAYDALVARQAVRLPAGTPIAVVPAPTEGGSHAEPEPASD